MKGNVMSDYRTLSYALVAFSAWALVYLVMRLITGNLGRGAQRREPVGPAGLAGFALGALYLAAFTLKWGREDWWEYQWQSEWITYDGLGDLSDLVTTWVADYFLYARDLHYVAVDHLPLWGDGMWAALPYVGAALIAGVVLSTLIRAGRKQPLLGPVQDLAIGFFAPMGLAPIAAFAYGTVVAVLLLFMLVAMAVLLHIFRPSTRWS
jgi:hypothetical protein